MGVAWGFRAERPARLVLASNFVDKGTVAVRVDRFEQAWELPGQVSNLPPNWMARHPLLVNAWFRLFRERSEGGPTYAVSTRYEVTDCPVPQAPEIPVKGEWLRIPIDVRQDD